MNWTTLAEVLISGKYTIYRNARGNYAIWYYGGPEPQALAQDVDSLVKAKDIAKNHRRLRYTGVAAHEEMRG